jgi:hypothetical protein
MEPRHLYTLRWTQPYSTDQLRPYLRALQLELEASIEALLDEMEYTEANAVIERIKQL